MHLNGASMKRGMPPYHLVKAGDLHSLPGLRLVSPDYRVCLCPLLITFCVAPCSYPFGIALLCVN